MPGHVLHTGMHRPFYTDSIYGNTLEGDVGFTQDLRAALERLFFQFEVRLTRPLAVLVFAFKQCPVVQAHSACAAHCSIALKEHCRQQRFAPLQVLRLVSCGGDRWMPHGTVMCTSTRGRAQSFRCVLCCWRPIAC